jgi:formamidopyrimidine-DNA glycosylase
VPELPEVETIVRELRPHVVGATIVDATVDWPRILAAPAEDIASFRRGVQGRRIDRVWRRGKFIAFTLIVPPSAHPPPVGARRDAPASQIAAANALSLLIHLRMSGRLTLAPGGRPEHLRIHFVLSTGALYFYCQRKFGRVWLVEDPQRVLADLGPEPLSPALTRARFAEMLGHRRGMIKPLLLNQRFIAGLGNIYVDEALYRARLHPCRTADTFSEDEIGRLYRAVRAVLRQALEHHGTSFDGIFVRPQGQEGRQQEGLLVYGQAGEPCARCSTPIERIVVGGRGTHLCPRCQPGPQV